MTSSTSPARRVRDALEPIAALSFYSDPFTEAYQALELREFNQIYFWSRSSPLGVAEPDVVAATFAVWDPGLVRENLAIGRSACSLERIRRISVTTTGQAARDVLADVDRHDIETVVAVLRRGVDAADGTGRPLFTGNRAWAWPTDPYEQLWRAATAWRELRGDSHVAACVAAGISGIEANVLTELQVGYPLGEYTRTRNWSLDDIQRAADGLRGRGLLDGDRLSESGRAFRQDLEDTTDHAVAPAIDALGADLDQLVEQANGWADLIIKRGWFPDDEQKRNAG